MQFPLRALMILMVVVSVFCGLVFGAPPIVTLPALLVILWISPAVWINGIIYGRGAWRPFFIGGTMGGLAPHLGALYYSIMSAVALLDDIDGSWAELVALGTTEAQWANIYIATIFLIPGVFALFGGLAGVWTYWMFQPAKTKPSAVIAPQIERAASAVPPSHLEHRSREGLHVDGNRQVSARSTDRADGSHG
jgi:hypothetical protein